MNSSDYITVYDNLIKKYNLKIIKNDEWCEIIAISG